MKCWLVGHEPIWDRGGLSCFACGLRLSDGEVLLRDWTEPAPQRSWWRRLLRRDRTSA
jgi:hypothetical protein